MKLNREQAIEVLKQEIGTCEYNLNKSPSAEYLGQAAKGIFESRIAAFKLAISALEQEPCEDAISRESVLLSIQRYNETQGGFSLINSIKALPSVTPSRKSRCE